ncbi:MAG: glycosyltransferase [Proteobacteria bacterium]|nr:glycosyltransferase [Pseudomonadota bacterium]
MKTHIAYFIDQLGIGGTERQLKFLIEGFDRSRFDITLFLLRGEKEHPFKPQNVQIEMLDVHSLFSFKGLHKLFQTARLLKKHNCRIVQTFFQDATIFGILAAKLSGAKTIVSIRDLLFWSTPLYSFAHRIVTLMADTVLVNSFAIKNHIAPLILNKKIHVIHNGICFDPLAEDGNITQYDIHKEFGFENHLPVIILVSNCNRTVKRVDILIESIPRVVQKIPAFFLIVGDGHLKPALEKRAEDLNIQKYVKFAGHRQDVDSLLRGSNIALNTSDSEGFSNSVMEAMKEGIPVIASNVDGNKELIENEKTGLLFEKGNHNDLSEKILRLLSDRKFAISLGNNGKIKIKEQFDIAHIIQQHSIFYESLAGNR